MNRWRHVDRSSAGRPALSDNECILFVQSSVGLYDGYNTLSIPSACAGKSEQQADKNSKYKSPNHQDGTIYLTSHRVCYIDDARPMLDSIAVDLDQIDKIETSVRSVIRTQNKLTKIGRLSKVFAKNNPAFQINSGFACSPTSSAPE